MSADDPNKKHIDARFVSSQKHEEQTFVDAIQKKLPKATAADIRAALDKARKNLGNSEGREKLTAEVEKILKE